MVESNSKGTRRPQLTDEDLKKAVAILVGKIHERLDEKGKGIFMTSHEVYGIISEEHHELLHAIETGTGEEIYDEMLDIAVAALVGMASAESGGMEW